MNRGQSARGVPSMVYSAQHCYSRRAGAWHRTAHMALLVG